jgi:hypothetical protein
MIIIPYQAHSLGLPKCFSIFFFFLRMFQAEEVFLKEYKEEYVVKGRQLSKPHICIPSASHKHRLLDYWGSELLVCSGLGKGSPFEWWLFLPTAVPSWQLSFSSNGNSGALFQRRRLLPMVARHPLGGSLPMAALSSNSSFLFQWRVATTGDPSY